MHGIGADPAGPGRVRAFLERQRETFGWDRIAGPRPGDAALQFAAIPVGYVAAAFVLTDIFFVFGGRLGQGSAVAIMLLTAVAAIVLARPFGRRTLPLSAGLAVLLFVLATVAARQIIDISYDGQDYHYTAIWALADGWNPYHDLFENHVAPGSDMEIWAPLFPKSGWIYGALGMAAGLGVEGAKTATVLLAAAAAAAGYGVARRAGWSVRPALAAAALVVLNPIIVVELFARMNDGVMASLYALFLAFAVLGLLGRDWRGTLVALAVLAVMLNTKQSGIVTGGVLCATLCVLALLRRGRLVALRHAGLLLGWSAVAVFVLGADPYLRNLKNHGNPVYPMIGSDVQVYEAFRPPAMTGRAWPEQLALSVAARTEYAGPHYKPPFTMSAAEFAAAGDPEVFLGGFGPLYSGVVLIGLAITVLLAVRRPGWRSPAGTLAIVAIGVTLSACLTPESWAVRYVPQFVLVPVLLGAALWTTGRDKWLVPLGIAATLANIGVVAASAVARQGDATRAIDAQARRLAQARGPYLVDVRASPARIGLLQERGVDVTPADLPRDCRDRETLPNAWTGGGTDESVICRVP